MTSKKEEIIICGLNAVLAQAKACPGDLIKLLYVKERLDRLKPLLKKLAKEGIAYEEVASEKIERVSKSTHHEGVALISRRKKILYLSDIEKEIISSKDYRCLYLGEIENPHNLGAIIRSAVHFSFLDIVIENDTAINASACYRTAEGGHAQIRIIKASWDQFSHFCEKNKINIVATAVNKGENLFKINLPSKYVLMFGEEGEGLSGAKMKRADNIVNIPGSSKIESMNVSCAASVIFAEMFRKNYFEKS